MSLSETQRESANPADAVLAEMVAEHEQLAAGQLTMPPPPAEMLPLDVPTPEAGDSYSQILKSSSIVGSAQAITLLLGMARTKGVAVLIGPSGLGEVSLLISATQLLATVSGLGIGSSAVREVAEAHSAGDEERLALTIQVLRRICWLTGIAGWILVAAFSLLLSRWSFGDYDHAVTLSILGVTILLGQVSAGQAALIRGVRRIGDLARETIAGAVLATIVSLGLYVFMGRDGIVPVLIVVSLCGVATSWWYARRVHFEPVSLSWRQTFVVAGRFVGLGVAFMYASLVLAASGWAIQVIVTRNFGTVGNGIYSAAWTMSGQFAAFVLAAMSADYFPRLTSVAADHRALNRLVNEQTEIGILLALPGLIATLAFAPLAVRLFYSADFLPAAKLLPWFVLGIFGRVISWPMSFVQLALGQAKLFATLETLFGMIHVGLVVALTWSMQIEGAGVAFAVLYVLFIFSIRFVIGYITGFQWSAAVRKLLAYSLCLLICAFILSRVLPQAWATAVIGMVAVVTGFCCVRALIARLGTHHRVTRIAAKIPWLVGKSGNLAAQ
jgi:enterobacterial common antigen flippase